jgi:mediator of RNA polymerase II transcription subunit 27
MLDQLITQIGRLYPDMTFSITRPNGTKLNALVEVTLERMLKAVLIFKGLMIEWVIVKGYGEESSMSSDGQVDVWSDSKHTVFRRITENANAAMLNFQSPVYPELAVRSYMVSVMLQIRSELKEREVAKRIYAKAFR